jgi:predicted nucleic acid-binding protein
MPQLVVDAGPLIAVFHLQDIEHQTCLARFKQILDGQYNLLTTFPVLCEVHKLIQRYASPPMAQAALIELREALEIVPFDGPDVEDAIALVAATSEWKGTLQDASVIVLTRQFGLPVWTLDYRDFSRFPDVKLWN